MKGESIMRPDDRKMSGKSKVYWILILLGFMAMEFPGVLFFKDKAEPYIFGFPFIYGFILCCWAYMCIVIFIAFKDNWGEPKNEAHPAAVQGGGSQ